MTFRPRRFTSAMMRHRITVQTPSGASDNLDEAGQPQRVWTTTLSGEPADFTPTVGGEVIRGKQVEAGISAIFLVRYRDSVYTPEQRIVHNGTTYGVVYVRQVEGGRRYLELHCKA